MLRERNEAQCMQKTKKKELPENTIYLPDYDVIKKGQKKIDESEQKKIPFFFLKNNPKTHCVVQFIDLLIAMGILFIIIIELMWCRPWSPIFGE